MRVHIEQHGMEKTGWLRAAVLGANDGIVSTASLLIGVASANVSHENILLTGVAGLVSGAMSMATGEYVSVSSQADTEQAALAQEKMELRDNYNYEVDELAQIYVKRGLDLPLAKQVAINLMKSNALAAHARDELGISQITKARPLQAAFASAVSFAVGAVLPLLIVLLSPVSWIIPSIVLSTLFSLALLGGIAAKIGNAPVKPSVLRITFWSALAMVITYTIGSMFNLSIQ